MVKIEKTLFIILSLLHVGCNIEETPYSNSLISSPHPLASQAGKIIYSKGGNAFDAAVASAFALSVVEPSMSGIGGRLQVIYKQAGGAFSVGPISGAVFNPAVSLGPTLSHLIIGDGISKYYLWYFLLGPTIGSVIGTFAFIYLVKK